METKFAVTGMTCAMCVQHVTKALQSVAGVQSATVDLSSATATAQHEETASIAAMEEAISEEGYEARRLERA